MARRPKQGLSDEQIGRLRETLTNLRNTNAGYPVAAARLLDLAGVDGKLVPQLSGWNRKQLQSTAKTMAKGHAAKEALICLAEDVVEVAGSAPVLRRVLELAKQKTAGTHMYTAAHLKEYLVTAFQKPFAAACTGFIERRRPPPGFGVIKFQGRDYFFRLDDVIGAQAPVARTPASSTPELVAPPAAPQSIADDILATFERLDAQSGGQNYVSLRDLRNSLPGIERSAFDDAVNQLRSERIVSLDPADGRHERPEAGVTEAAIVDQGQWLVYMRRRDR